MLNWLLSLLGLGKSTPVHVPIVAPVICGKCAQFKAHKRGGVCPFFVRGRGRSTHKDHSCDVRNKFIRL